MNIVNFIIPGMVIGKVVFCEHPDQDYIMQYFNERDIRSMPGFIGYTGWNDNIVPCKYTPRWCPRKKGGV